MLTKSGVAIHVLPDAVGENAYTLTVANDVSAIIPALDMSNPKCIVVKARTSFSMVCTMGEEMAPEHISSFTFVRRSQGPCSSGMTIRTKHRSKFSIVWRRSMESLSGTDLPATCCQGLLNSKAGETHVFRMVLAVSTYHSEVMSACQLRKRARDLCLSWRCRRHFKFVSVYGMYCAASVLNKSFVHVMLQGTVLRHMMDNASVDQLTFVVRRPTERVVVLPKSDRLGLDISFRKQVSIRHTQCQQVSVRLVCICMSKSRSWVHCQAMGYWHSWWCHGTMELRKTKLADRRA